MSPRHHTSLLLTLLVLLSPTLGATDTDQAAYYIAQLQREDKHQDYCLFIHQDTLVSTIRKAMHTETIQSSLWVMGGRNGLEFPFPNKDPSEDVNMTILALINRKESSTTPLSYEEELCTKQKVVQEALEPYNTKHILIFDKDKDHKDTIMSVKAFVDANHDTLKDFLNNLRKDQKEKIDHLTNVDTNTHDGPNYLGWGIGIGIVLGTIYGAKVRFFPSEDDAEDPKSSTHKDKKNRTQKRKRSTIPTEEEEEDDDDDA